MTPDEMFQKALDAWGVTVASPVDNFHTARVLMYEGEPTGITWSPECTQDLLALHGEDTANDLVLFLINMTARHILGMPEDEDVAA